MLNLDTNASVIRAVTSGTADIDVLASWTDFTPPSTFDSQNTPTLIVTATTTTLVGAPSTGTTRNVRGLNIRNSHASSSNTVRIEFFDGTNIVELFNVTLAAGEVLVMNEQGVWFVYDTNGGVKMGASAASDTLAGVIQTATQAEMESATSTTDAVTPARQHFHPGHGKLWVKCGVTANILGSYNVTSLTDTGTGQVTVTINVDFSSTNWACQVNVERTSTSLTVANLRQAAVRNAGQAAGTVLCECWDGTATTALQTDPTAWHINGLGDQ